MQQHHLRPPSAVDRARLYPIMVHNLSPSVRRRNKILIDPVDVYAEAIAREYLGLPWLV